MKSALTYLLRLIEGFRQRPLKNGMKRASGQDPSPLPPLFQPPTIPLSSQPPTPKWFSLTSNEPDQSALALYLQVILHRLPETTCHEGHSEYIPRPPKANIVC